MKPGDSVEVRDAAVDFRTLFRDLRRTLRSGGRDLQPSLQAIVELLAGHFRSDVCSLYRLEEARGDLVLWASKGLRAEAIGRTTLHLGEGLVGTIAETRRPLALENAQADARFMFRPETGEEIYRSFLGVPLIRARNLLGVLVVQHREPCRYSPEEIEDCETVAQFLSEMFHQVSGGLPAPREAGAQGALRLSAAVLSPGLAVGTAVFHLKDVVIRRWYAADPAPELIRLKIALEELEESLEALMGLPDAADDPETRELLEADLMLARDKGWREKIGIAVGRGLSAEAAVQSVREELKERMKAITNDYLRARLLDLDDLSHRLLARLTGGGQRDLSAGLPPGSILVCRSLGTAELLQLSQEGLAGLVVVDATPSSHLAIIASSLGIPALGQAPDALTEVGEGDPLILDAVNGQLIARPDPAVVTQFEAHVAARRTERDREQLLPERPFESRDGVAMQVMGNAGLLLDLDEIARFETVGVGLYRTEMAFLVRPDLPGVEEQARLYRRIYERMGERPVVFRTLDVGSDKKLSYLEGQLEEANPALGWRAIRVGLDHPDLLRDQFRALLLAAEGRALKVMFPMISEAEEFAAARGLLDRVLEAHLAEGGAAPEPLEVGLMIEVPALLWDLERVLALADFASVGTNDLFQFLNAADRNNARTDTRYEPLRPANLRLLASIAETAGRLGAPVGICGELAGTPLGAIALIGCGFRSFSMSAARIPGIARVLRALDVGQVEARIQELAARPGGSLREEIAALARDFGIEVP